MLGVYEKAMPADLSILEKLNLAQKAGFDFLELSVDETEEKLSRLNDREFVRTCLNAVQKTGLPILTLCLSGHRKYALGDRAVGERSLTLLFEAVDFALELGIRIIQLAGYDIFYGQSTVETEALFFENLKRGVSYAASKGMLLGFETMETPFMNTVRKARYWVDRIRSPFLQIYPDLGNIRNGTEDYLGDLRVGAGHILAAHLKETREGVYRNLMFGEGRVDFKGCIAELQNQGVGIFNCEFWYDGVSDPAESLDRARNFFRRLGL